MDQSKCSKHGAMKTYCAIKPNYGEIGVAEFCDKCAEKAFYFKGNYCTNVSCITLATHRFKTDEFDRFCEIHKDPKSFTLKDWKTKCVTGDCTTIAGYNNVPEDASNEMIKTTKGVFCKTHSVENVVKGLKMVDVRSKRCDAPEGCGEIATVFIKRVIPEGRKINDNFCAKHGPDGAEDHNPKCVKCREEGKIVRANYGPKGIPFMFCSKHNKESKKEVS